QFSVYDLTLDAINLIGTDPDTGEETATDIKPSNDPKITGASIVDILYQLTGSDQPTLDRFDGNQTLTLALGQQETEITLTDNNTIRFENLDYLNQLGSDDYLTIAIYTNEDAGNLLYEYMFGRNGLHVYYKIPHEEIELIGAENFPQVEQEDFPDVTGLGDGDMPPRLVRTLGGMRLKYQYHPPEVVDPITHEVRWRDLDNIEWKFNSPGWYCKTAGVTIEAQNCTFKSANEIYKQEDPIGWVIAPNHNLSVAGLPDWSVWWEPSIENGLSVQPDWTLPDNKTRNFKAEFKANLKNMAPSVQKFIVQRRMISPKEIEYADGTKGPMFGSDVQMLEQLLWQLGLSPQIGSRGTLGARIDSIRYRDVYTTDCKNELADKRNRYYAGMPNTCVTGKVSLEQFIRRYQSRHVSKLNWSNDTHSLEGDGWVGNGTLDWLQEDWKDYATAYASYSADPIIDVNHTSMSSWVEDTVDIWENGLGDNIPQTLTDVRFKAILSSAGLNEDSKTRGGLLKAWKYQESPFHWGTNASRKLADGSRVPYQATPYRMLEGGADEFGSLSFSQIMYQYRYSPVRCSVFVEYPMNFYSPVENLQSFAIFTSMYNDSDNGCDTGSFRLAYSDEAGLSHDYEDSLSGLVGYRQGSDVINGIGSKDDAYEVFAKAIGIYNGNGASFKGHSWPYQIKERVKPRSGTSNAGDNCYSC
ncbi:MAG: hypothetical protein P8X89_24580, partial [Reinekea sp.]